MKRSTFTASLTAAALAVPAGVRVAYAADDVSVGTSNSSSDVPFFIADKLGYFKEQNLTVKLQPFDSAAKMVAPLGAGQLDVAAGAPSAGLYNAVLQNIDLKIVADKGSTPKGYGYLPLLVRADLVKSGKFKSFKDLKGLKVAEPAQGTTTSSTLNEALKRGDLAYNSVEHIYLGFPQHVPAFENGSIDASLTTEPSATLAVRSGAAVRFASDDTFYPNQQLAVLLYGGNFIQKRRDIGVKFMIAYIKAARYYNDALSGGKLRGKNAASVLDILTEYTPVKDRKIYEESVPNGNDPDGHVNIGSLKNDLAFFKEQKLVTGNIMVEQVHDGSFVDTALKSVGRYHRSR
ncbi:MAG: ABC transporter substrate-binding protein [Candidatus Velthaea sp.]